MVNRLIISHGHEHYVGHFIKQSLVMLHIQKMWVNRDINTVAALCKQTLHSRSMYLKLGQNS